MTRALINTAGGESYAKTHKTFVNVTKFCEKPGDHPRWSVEFSSIFDGAKDPTKEQLKSRVFLTDQGIKDLTAALQQAYDNEQSDTLL